MIFFRKQYLHCKSGWTMTIRHGCLCIGRLSVEIIMHLDFWAPELKKILKNFFFKKKYFFRKKVLKIFLFYNTVFFKKTVFFKFFFKKFFFSNKSFFPKKRFSNKQIKKKRFLIVFFSTKKIVLSYRIFWTIRRTQKTFLS